MKKRSIVQRATLLCAGVLLLAAGAFVPLLFETQSIELSGLKRETQLIDVTGDGFDDLTLFQIEAPSGLVVIPNLGDGSFGEALPTYSVDNAWSVSLDDANADGRADLLEVRAIPATIRVHLGQSDGSFEELGDYGDFNEANEAILAELNGDGILDLVVTSGEGITCCRLDTLLGNGDGSFTPFWKINVEPAYIDEFFEFLGSLRPVASGDLDGDGLTDIVLGPYIGQLFWMKGRGDGRFSTLTGLRPREGGYRTVDLADLDNDGDLDVVSRAPSGPNQTGPIAAFLNSDSGGFNAPVFSSEGGRARWHSELADFDLDGWTDLAGYDTASFVASGRGDGTFDDPRPVHEDFEFVRAVAAGDSNADGLPDLAAVVASPELALVFTNAGEGPVLPAVGTGLAGVTSTPRLVGIGDLSPNSSLSLRLSCAAPGAPMGLFVGASAAWLPFKGGVLVPSPDSLFSGPLVSDEGTLELSFRWPVDVPEDVAVWMQAWVLDAAAPVGFSASNGLRAGPP